MKKLNTFQKFIFIFSITTFIYSCTSDNSEIKESNNITFSKENIIEIGKMHNEYLSKAYENFDYNSKTKYVDLKNNLLSIEIPELTYEEKEKAIEFGLTINSKNQKGGLNKSSNDIESLKESLESQLAKDIVDLAYNNLNVLENHTEFSNELVGLKKSASINLENTDLVSVLSFLEVLEQSSLFWKPIELGGSGEGYSILLNIQNQDQAAKGVSPCTKAVVAADGTGAATAVLSAGIGGWIAGALNPGAMAAAVGIAAAAASITASQTHYACQDKK
ncbi:hypothetical protein N9K09_02425 [Flavobacteriaceae bacterium]|nr:hypothetical protein [Flavobacteriaceae bacterium]